MEGFANRLFTFKIVFCSNLGEGLTCSASTVGKIFNRLKDELLEWEGVYNTVRPHQALSYVTPLKFLEQWKECLERRMCH